MWLLDSGVKVAAVLLLAICPAFGQSLLDPSPGFGSEGNRSSFAAAPPIPPAGGPPPVPATAELMERLQAAEQRIAELETGGRDTGNGSGFATASDGASSRAAFGGETDTSTDSQNGESEDVSQDVEDLSKKLDELQKEWDKHQESLKKAADAAANKPTFETGGRIHLDYWDVLQSSEGIGFFEHPNADDPQFGTDPESRFLFRRVRLEFEGDVPDLMFWRMQLDFNRPERPQIKDVYLGWELPANHRMIIGHQKLPMGADALYSSRFTPFMERPQVVDAFLTDYRRLGAMMYGFSDDRVFNWRYGLFEMQNLQEEGRYIGDSLQLGAFGRLASTLWYDESSNGRGYLHLGVSGSIVRPDGDVTDADSNDNVAHFAARPEGRTDRVWIDTGAIAGARWYEQNGLEAVLNLGALQLTGEFLSTWVQRDNRTSGTGPDVHFHGGYVQAAYFLTGEHIPWDREEGVTTRIHPFENFFLVDRCTGGTGSGWGAWQVATRYDYIDLTDNDIEGGVENNLTLAVNWWWNSHARMQVNATRGLIEERSRVGGFDSGDFWLVGTRLDINF